MTLPTFLIIGAAKCGTTSLFRHIGAHPDVFVSHQKEPHYFISDDPAMTSMTRRGRTVSERSAYELLFEDGVARPARGEASTAYLNSSRAPERAHEVIPHARLIAVLRDPVERAYSAWGHLRRTGHEPIGDFLEAVEAEPRRTAQGGHPVLSQYIATGSYHRHLERWLEFFDRDQLLVHLTEDLARDPDRSLALSFEHIGVAPRTVSNPTVRYNPGGMPRSRHVYDLTNGRQQELLRRTARTLTPDRLRRGVVRRLRAVNETPHPPLTDEMFERLAPRFTDDVAALRELLGRDLREWRTASLLDPER